MKVSNSDIRSFMDKIKKAEKGHRLDLSSDEDLSIAIMNLISIEEHLFFSGNKTGKTHYFDLLKQARQMRKTLLKEIIKDYEGEVWCISKHLLAASMRLMEVGTKTQTGGDDKKAKKFFKQSYDLYNLFWGLNLGLVKPAQIKTIKQSQVEKQLLAKKDILGKISSVISSILDCCRE